jgi:hypothetical protein
MRGTKQLLFIISILALAACQDLRWENRSIPQSQWAADQGQCAESARNLSQRRLLARPSYIEQWRPGPEGDAVRRREDDLARREAADDTEVFEDCMRRKGYERVARTRAEP